MLTRRKILQSASSAFLLSSTPPKRIAYGGISIECSTYSRIRTKEEDFTILRGEEFAKSERFAFLKATPTRSCRRSSPQPFPADPSPRKLISE